MPSRRLKALPIDISEVCMALDTSRGDVVWFIDAKTGELTLVSPESGKGGDEGPTRDELERLPKRYLPFPVADRRAGIQDMKAFAAQLEDERLRESLEMALTAPAPFRRFKSVLQYVPEERERWLRFRRKRLEERAHRWLARHGLKALDK